MLFPKKCVVCGGKFLIVDGDNVVVGGACLFMQVSSMHVLSMFMMYWNLS